MMQPVQRLTDKLIDAAVVGWGAMAGVVGIPIEDLNAGLETILITLSIALAVWRLVRMWTERKRKSEEVAA
jgi:predicted RND superfamily exporter protein